MCGSLNRALCWLEQACVLAAAEQELSMVLTGWLEAEQELSMVLTVWLEAEQELSRVLKPGLLTAAPAAAAAAATTAALCILLSQHCEDTSGDSTSATSTGFLAVHRRLYAILIIDLIIAYELHRLFWLPYRGCITRAILLTQTSPVAVVSLLVWLPGQGPGEARAPGSGSVGSLDTPYPLQRQTSVTRSVSAGSVPVGAVAKCPF
ncbi:hypothetical protein NHX12_011452 [Muraenolepis orangiensis]|uniref:XK-related protein n=1 Tax=Muraenolepis orangiensis TaxID=630683 RepID=A0A9Q0DGG0_9TELE|nr:hypothetical protein NHX12_011452 [Muraenolepis orangiensis]